MSRQARGVWRRRLRRVVAAVAAPVVAVTVVAAGYDVASEGTVPAPPLGAHGHRVRTGDIESHYEQWGHTGPPIVLVHGFLESAAVWDRVGPVLARDGYRVYALDVRGFGYTERRGPYTLAGDTAQLSAFLSALHLGRRPAAVRRSWWGTPAARRSWGALARAQPADVRGVVFLDGDGTPYGVGPAWVHRLVLDPYATAADPSADPPPLGGRAGLPRRVRPGLSRLRCCRMAEAVPRARARSAPSRRSCASRSSG